MLRNKPLKYNDKTNVNNANVITKNIRFDGGNAIRINTIIRKFNNENQILKMNNDIILNLIVNAYLEKFDSDNVIVDDLKKRALESEGIQ